MPITKLAKEVIASAPADMPKTMLGQLGYHTKNSLGKWGLPFIGLDVTSGNASVGGAIGGGIAASAAVNAGQSLAGRLARRLGAKPGKLLGAAEMLGGFALSAPAYLAGQQAMDKVLPLWKRKAPEDVAKERVAARYGVKP